MRSYKYLNHTADLGIEVKGKTLKDLFKNIGKAIFETQISGKIAEKEERRIEIKSDSVEDLFLDWCRELLFNFSVRGFIPKRYKITIKDLNLKAWLKGDLFDQEKQTIRIEIKNPTYHNLSIKRCPTGYKARIIFDV